MALAAFRELCHDAGRMGCAMAVLAFGHHLVLFLMAECACEVLVLGLAGAQKVKSLAVACAAVFRRGVRSIGHNRRHMRLVAFFAVNGSHFSRVRFVALGALRDLAVDVMALGAVKGGMLALEFPELLNLLRMAGETGVRNVRCK